MHVGHLAIAKVVRDELHLDELILVPAGDPYLRIRPPEASAEARVEMVALAGGLAAAGDRLFEPTRRAFMDRGTVGVREHVRIVPASLGDDAGLLGAARLSESTQ